MFQDYTVSIMWLNETKYDNYPIVTTQTNFKMGQKQIHMETMCTSPADQRDRINYNIMS